MTGVPERVRLWEHGHEAAWFTVAALILELREHGMPDSDALDALMALAELRLAAGAEDPVGQLTGNDDGHGT